MNDVNEYIDLISEVFDVTLMVMLMQRGKGVFVHDVKTCVRVKIY
jgi:hypothetical protein